MWKTCKLITAVWLIFFISSPGRPAWVDMHLANRLKIPHTFVLHTYTKPTKCHFCNKVFIDNQFTFFLPENKMEFFRFSLVFSNRDFSAKIAGLMFTRNVLSESQEIVQVFIFKSKRKSIVTLLSRRSSLWGRWWDDFWELHRFGWQKWRRKWWRWKRPQVSRHFWLNYCYAQQLWFSHGDTNNTQQHSCPAIGAKCSTSTKRIQSLVT